MRRTNDQRLFENASYLGQVRRLRKLADEVIRFYPIRVSKLTLVRHVENTTFRVLSKSGNIFYLRIHRPHFQSEEAIKEEHRWIDFLNSKTNLNLLSLVRTRNGKGLIVHRCSALDGEPRYCDLFTAVQGRSVRKSLSDKHMMLLGLALGEMHRAGRKFKVRTRIYWDSEHLIFKKPKWGRLQKVKGMSAKEMEYLFRAEKKTYTKLRRFEKSFPDRLGMIHADAHVGNFFFSGNKVSFIDFDDCGYGFFNYDLAVVSHMITAYSRRSGRKELMTLFNSFLDSYSKVMPYDEADKKVIPYLRVARSLFTIAWLQSRSDHPRLVRMLLRRSRFSLDLIRSEKLF